MPCCLAGRPCPDRRQGRAGRSGRTPPAGRLCDGGVLSAAGLRAGEAASCRGAPPLAGEPRPPQPDRGGGGVADLLGGVPRVLHEGGTAGPADRAGTLGFADGGGEPAPDDRDGTLGPELPRAAWLAGDAAPPDDLTIGGSGGADEPFPLPPAGPATPLVLGAGG